jgi:hypothetical protein
VDSKTALIHCLHRFEDWFISSKKTEGRSWEGNHSYYLNPAHSKRASSSSLCSSCPTFPAFPPPRCNKGKEFVGILKSESDFSCVYFVFCFFWWDWDSDFSCEADKSSTLTNDNFMIKWGSSHSLLELALPFEDQWFLTIYSGNRSLYWKVNFCISFCHPKHLWIYSLPEEKCFIVL